MLKVGTFFMSTSASAEKAAAESRDFTKYADKPPTDLQTRFSAWILDKTAYEPEDMDSFNEGVRLATALRMAFQASPENQETLEERRKEAEAKKAAPKKRAAKKAKVSNPEPEDVEDDVEEDADDEAEETTPEPVKRKPGKRVKATPKAEDADDEDDAEAPF